MGVYHPLPSAIDGLPEAVDVLVVHFDIGHPEESGDRLFGRAGEVRANHVSERVVAGRFGGDRREVDVARPVLLVAYESTLIEDSEDGADGRIGGRIGEIAHDLGDGGFAATVEDVHHLPFAAGEGGGGRLTRCGRIGHRELT
jgi:hypothetical protein